MKIGDAEAISLPDLPKPQNDFKNIRKYPLKKRNVILEESAQQQKNITTISFTA